MLLPLLPCLTILLIAATVIGENNWQEFISGFKQVIYGALSPFSTAQTYLESASHLLETHSALYAFAMTLTKFAAITLLPFPILNGGAAILALLCKDGKIQAWEHKIMQILVMPTLLIYLSWIAAFAYYIWTH